MKRKGEGLNSIPVRFGLMGALTGALAIFGLLQVIETGLAGWKLTLSIGLSVLMPALITFLAAKKLTSQILALRRSTEALVAGDFNTPVNVDCACEVGGLADSFSKMAKRLNNNILRMNVLAYADDVTGLPNRAVVFHLLDQLAKTPGIASFSVLFIDLDGFKRINDMHGHEVGDELLRRSSGRIAEALGKRLEDLETCMTTMGELCNEPPRDTVLARFSGDEFVALLPQSSGNAEELAAAILTSLEQPFEIDGAEVHVGASIGLARYPKDANTPEDLLNMADLAMYEAKRTGRGRVVCVTSVLRSQWQDRRDVENALRHAIENDEICLAFQPRFATPDLTCNAVEALARWNHPTRGPISPAIFIPIAEQAGLMPLLGAVVFEQAVRQCRAWQDQGHSISVSVNVSPAEFTDPNLVRRLLGVLEKYEVHPDLIEVEITETMAMGDFETTQEQMMALRQAGLKIAIDDFGTGYSNLSQLSRLPYTSMKLDRSLVIDVSSRPRSLEIVRAVAAMAKTLGHTIIIEGIETREQYEALSTISIDEVQGFLFSNPLQPDAIPALVTLSKATTSPLQTGTV
ncbi:Cyclic di-GMP phosphodiesterase Gmr [Phaeobacter sp. CECT 5382]|nr:Cyclic di-GMP phosphodiesterase Gmr [Phaeobacter sp. CECT 5382]